LILDTTVLIAAERTVASLDGVIGDEDDVSIAAVTAAELLVGVELADRRRRPRRAAFVDEILSSVPIEPYGLEVAREHAALLAHTRRIGSTRGAHDLIVAATARTRDRTIVTTDPGGFSGLPGVELRSLPIR
jgi:tRNA(fMet)-specific endonuclease VapC